MLKLTSAAFALAGAGMLAAAVPASAAPAFDTTPVRRSGGRGSCRSPGSDAGPQAAGSSV